MSIKGLLFTAAALLIFSGPSAFAQSQPAGPAAAPAPGTVGERKENQQDRIANGIQSGQLTAGETKNLESKEAGLNKKEHTQRSEDDGHLTAADRQKLNNQQNHLSNQIYDDKHKVNAPRYGNNEVGDRRKNHKG